MQPQAIQLSRTERRKAARDAAKALRRVLSATRAVEQAHTIDGAFVLNNVPFANPLHAGKIDRVFAPLERLLATICETGEIECLDNGTPIIRQNNGSHYSPAAGSMHCMCETYEKLARTHGWTDETDGLRKLAKRLELDMPIFQEDVDRARRTIDWMKERSLTITPAQFSAESIEVRIHAELHGLDR